MTLNQIKQAAEIAKSRTSDKRWIAAIDKALAGVESGWWIITELATCLAITTESGNTYFANGVCQCEAYHHSQACKHRALYRLYAIANETAAGAVSLEQDVAASSREHLIAEIANLWPRVCDTPLPDALMARFGVNYLDALSIDFLRGIRLALA